MGEEGKGVSVTVSHAQLLDDQAHVSLDSRMVVRLLLKGQGNGKQAKKEAFLGSCASENHYTRCT